MLKVAIVGCGNVTKFHCPGWAASPHAELVAGVDIDGSVLEPWGERYGVKRLTTELAEVLNDPSVDIIDVCVPNRAHTDIVIAALEAGKHVICEKPLAATVDEIGRMIQARDRSGKQLMTAQHYRFSGAARAMKAEIEQGALGEIYHARTWMLRRNTYINKPGFVEFALSGGGASVDIGVHALDLTLWLMGAPKPVSVSGFARTELAKQPGFWSRIGPDVPAGPNWDVEEFAGAFVRFANGATLMLEVAWALHHDAHVPTEIEMWLYGKDGGAQYPQGKFLSSNPATRQQYIRTLGSMADVMEPHAFECVEFARILSEGGVSPVPPEQSLDVMAILTGIYESQKEGREIRLQ